MAESLMVQIDKLRGEAAEFAAASHALPSQLMSVDGALRCKLTLHEALPGRMETINHG